MKNRKKIDLTKDKLRTGYQVPEGYFEIFKAILFKKLDFRNHQLEDTQKEELSKDIPNGYFSSLSDKLIEGIPFEDTKKVISMSKRTKVLSAIAVAASILLILNLNIGKPNSQNLMDSLSTETLATFIEQEQLFFTNDEMALLVEHTEFPEGTFMDFEMEDEHTLNYILDYVSPKDF